MPSELERVAHGLVETLDEVPDVVGLLQEAASRLRRHASAVADLARDDPAGRDGALLLDAAARACDQAAAAAGRAAPRARQWAESTARASDSDRPEHDSRTPHAAARSVAAGASGPPFVDAGADPTGSTSPDATDGADQASSTLRLSTSNPDHQEALTRPPPNTTIVVDDRFTYRTDDLGRVVHASTTLDGLDPDHPRDDSAQRTLLGKLPGDHAGHIFARIFKGPGATINLTPMEGRRVNQGQFRTLENGWRQALESGEQVEVSVELGYLRDSRRPDVLRVHHRIGTGRRRTTRIRNAPRDRGDI